MDVRAVSAGATGMELFSAVRGMAGPKGQEFSGLADFAQPPDTVAMILRELSGQEVVRFLEILERPLAPENAARLDGLLRASISEAALGNVQAALVKLAEFAALEPGRAETLDTEPDLASIRGDVERLLFRLASSARLAAELQLGKATQLAEEGGSQKRVGQDIRPEIAMLIAGRLLEAGGYANSMRSAELSRIVIDQYAWAANPPTLSDVAQSEDTIATLLRELPEQEIIRFLETYGTPITRAENAVRLEGLLRASISAVAERNVQQALVKLAEFAALDPRRAAALAMVQDLASIRADVRGLLLRLTSVARIDAELRLGQATHLLQVESKWSLGQEIRPEIALRFAGRLLEIGGYANTMRSAELSQMVIDLDNGVPRPSPLSLAGARSVPNRSGRVSPGWRNRWMPRIRELWLRAPLLVLLLAWLAVGLLGGSVYALLLRKYWPQTWPESLVAGSFEIWGVGFLALIAFGFYARVRHVRW